MNNLAQDFADALSTEEKPQGERPQGDNQNQDQRNAGAGGSEDTTIIIDDDGGQKQNNDAANADAAGKGEPDYEAKFTEMVGADSKTAKEWKSQLEAYKQQAEAVSYKNPIGKAFDELTSQGIPDDVALQYIKADEKTMDDVAFKAFKLQIEHPGISAEDARRKVERQYKIGEYKESDQGEQDGLLDLKLDTGKERLTFAQDKEKMLAPFKSREAVAKEQEAGQRMAQWEPEIPKVLEELKDLKLDAGINEKTKKALFQIPFKLKDTTVLAQEAKIILEATPSLVNTPEGRAEFKAIMRDRAILHNLPEILHRAARSGKTEAFTKIEQDHSPTDFKGNEQFDIGSRAAKTDDDEIVSAIEKAQNKKK